MKRNGHDALHDSLLSQGFQRWNGRLEGGRQVNNRLVLNYDELYETQPRLLGRLVLALRKQVAVHQSDAIVGVPDGGRGYAAHIARELGVYEIGLTRHNHQGHKSLDFADDFSREAAADASRIVLIDSVIDRRSNLQQVLTVGEIGEKAVAAVVLFDRSTPEAQQDLGIPVESLAAESIPDMLPHRSKLWHYAS